MNWKKTCRVCLQSGDVVSLFDWDHNNEQLCDKYAFCCGVEVPDADALPTLICLNCVDRLTVAYDFKTQCLSSNATLQECLVEFYKTSYPDSVNTLKEVPTDTITIKRDNAEELEYKLRVEHDSSIQYTITTTNQSAVVTKAPKPKKTGRPRKYPNESGVIAKSPYTNTKSSLSQEDLKQIESEIAAITNKSNVNLENEEDEMNSPNTRASSASVALSKENEETIDSDLEELNQEPQSEEDGAQSDATYEEKEVLEDDESEEEVKVLRKRGRPRSQKRMDIDKTVTALLSATMDGFVPTPDVEQDLLIPITKIKKKKVKEVPKVKKKYFYGKTHKCETCGNAFHSNAKLQAHIRRHLGINPYNCSICDYTSPVLQNLKRHLLIHTNLRPYKCAECPKAYKDSGDLKKHMRTHNGVRPFQCSICDKTFTYSSVLNSHMVTHTREDKFECKKCHKKFPRASHMKYHNKVYHKSAPMPKHPKLKIQRINGNRSNKALDKSGIVTAEIVDGVVTVFHRIDDGEESKKPVDDDKLEEKTPRKRERPKKYPIKHTASKKQIKTERPPTPDYEQESQIGNPKPKRKIKAEVKTEEDSEDSKKIRVLGVRPLQCSTCKKTFTYSSRLTSHMFTHTSEDQFECKECHGKKSDSDTMLEVVEEVELEYIDEIDQEIEYEDEDEHVEYNIASDAEVEEYVIAGEDYEE